MATYKSHWIDYTDCIRWRPDTEPAQKDAALLHVIDKRAYDIAIAALIKVALHTQNENALMKFTSTGPIPNPAMEALKELGEL